jgi:hypothetical protein
VTGCFWLVLAWLIARDELALLIGLLRRHLRPMTTPQASEPA